MFGSIVFDVFGGAGCVGDVGVGGVVGADGYVGIWLCWYSCWCWLL